MPVCAYLAFMKRRGFLLGWLLLITTVGFGQKADSTTYQLGRTGDLKTTLWRFKAGDSLAWASPAYNDFRWISGKNPSDQFADNDALWQTGKGWYRLSFRLRKRLLTTPLVFHVGQIGRSALYLDGRLLATMGSASLDTAGNQTGYYVVPLTIADTSAHTLAIRYRFRRDPIITPLFEVRMMNLSLHQRDEVGLSTAFENLGDYGIRFFTIGLFALLSLLHFSFYRANRQQVIHRLLGWETLLFALTGADCLREFTATLTAYSALELLSNATALGGLVLLLTAVYSYLNLPLRWPYFLVIGLLTLLFGCSLFVNETPWYIITPAIVGFLVDYTRVSLRGRRQQDTHARLPWVSLKFSLYCFLAMLITIIVVGVVAGGSIKFDSNLVTFFTSGTLILGLLSVPVGLSLSLVYDYARTNNSLNAKVVEIGKLSAQTVAQEQEKQQLLARQNETLERLVAERTAALGESLTELRTTQAQLIQREKLASLGELTAGVAHEIQNPLNFVNNFSEVSVELLTELEQEQERPTTERDAGLERELLADIRQNMGKIGQHGQRAASIVRAMLEHSRASTPPHEPTDLNALVDEYLRLAYHGWQRSGASATDNPLAVNLETHFAPGLPLVRVAAPDVGRVLMNLFTNAFYAVQQRATQAANTPYQPTVVVTTEQADDRVLIRVRDNGAGITDAVRGKIFQPFFTTKPTGSGTGLGLSISYDIITKAHNGTLAAHSAPDAGAEFIITLPL